MKFPTVYEITQCRDLAALGLSVDIRGWHSTDPFFAKMIGEVKPKVVLEIGSWCGASALHMASLCDAQIYCVDTWLGGVDHWMAEAMGNKDRVNDLCRDDFGAPMLYHQFLVNVAASPYATRIHPIQQMSLHGVRLLGVGQIAPDLVYVDGSHHEDDVCADLHAVRKLCPSAVVFGDDYSFPPVANAVKKFADYFGLDYEVGPENEFWRLKAKPVKLSAEKSQTSNGMDTTKVMAES